MAVTLMLDHVILLLSSAEFDNPPAWLGDNFTILEGGEHTGSSHKMHP